MAEKYPLIMLEWEDHSGDAGWSDDVSIKEMKVPVATTIGWLVGKDRKTYKIADTLIDGGFDGVSNILRRTIINEWEIGF